MLPSWKYIKASEVCELLGHCRSWLWREIREGRFPEPDRFGATIRFRSDIVAEAMEKRSASAAEQREKSATAIKKASELGVAKRLANRLAAQRQVEQAASEGGAV